MTAPPARLDITTSTIRGRSGGIRVRDYRPLQQHPPGIPLLWVHGGGFSFGGIDTAESDAPARSLAEAGHWVRTVDYRLVPGTYEWQAHDAELHPNRYPAALHDVLDAAESLTSTCESPIAIGGASAGACIAASAVLALSEDSGGQKQFATAVLAYGTFHANPIVDPALDTSLTGRAATAFTASIVARMNLNYVRDPLLQRPGAAFPGGSQLAGFPATLLIDAENDRLRASGQAFYQELQEAGSHAEYAIIPGADHAFLDHPTSFAYSFALDRLREWLARY